MSCFLSFTEGSLLHLLIYCIMKFDAKTFGRKVSAPEYIQTIIISCILSWETITRGKKDVYINTWIHSRCSSLAGTICNNWRVYHDANLIKRAVGIHFTRLIYVWITTLFSAEISRRSGSATYLSLFITNTIIAAVDVLNPLIFCSASTNRSSLF